MVVMGGNGGGWGGSKFKQWVELAGAEMRLGVSKG